MLFTATFSNQGTPATGLSATIDIWRVGDNTQVVTGASMTEVGGGVYKYDYVGYDPDEAYVAICDGTATLSGYDRYVYGANRDDIEVSDKIPTNNFMGSSVKTDKDDEIDDILTRIGTPSSDIYTEMAKDSTVAKEAQATTNKNDIITEIDANETKIDALQSDVTDILADTNEIQGKLPVNNIADQTLIDDDLTTIEGKIDTVQADLDNPNQYKADVSALATEANATANTASIIAEVDANESKIDALQLDVTDILGDTNEMQGKLPVNDIADQTLIDDDLTTIEGKIDTVQADLDNPNQYKADVSALATEANATTNTTSIIAEVDANEVKIDTLETKIDAVQADLDNPNQYKADVSALATEANATVNKNEILTAIDDIDISADLVEVLALLHKWRVEVPSYDAEGNHNGSVIKLYGNKTDAAAETNEIATITFTVTRDVNGKPTKLKSVED